MADTFELNTDHARSAIQSYAALEGRTAPGEYAGTWAGDLVQGQMGALVYAELLAAQAGIVPWVTLPDGQKGVQDIGAARAHIDKAPEDVRTIYLAAHGGVRQSIALARPVRSDDPPVHEALAASYYRTASSEAIVPLIVVGVVVLGVAALAAHAWYATETKKKQIEVDADKAIAFAKAGIVADVARAELEKNGKVSSDTWKALAGIAREEAKEKSSPWPWIIGGTVLGLAAGGVVYVKTRKKAA